MNQVPSLTVAQKFLDIAIAQENELTPMQLIKLVYLAHGWMLAIHGRSLVSEDIEAWQYGPVIPRLYSAVKEYRSGPVLRLPSMEGETLSEDQIDVVEQVYSVYGDLSGIQLSSLTHQQGTPWDITWSLKGKSSVIPNDLIEQHFKELG